MKIKLTPEACDAFKFIASHARPRSLCMEDTAVLIEASDNDSVYVMAVSDSDVVYEATINTPVSEPGTCSVFGALFYNVIKRLTEPTLTSNHNNTRIEICEAESVVGIPAYYFKVEKPTIPTNAKFTTNASNLLAGFNDVNFAVTDYSVRKDGKMTASPVLTTMNVSIENDEVTFEGVQNAYGARFSFKLPCCGKTSSFTIPDELVKAAIALCRETPDEQASICCDSTRIAIRVGNITISCLRIVGSFPNMSSAYDIVHNDTVLICDVALLKEVVNVAIALTTDANNITTPLTLNIPAAGTGGVVTVTYSCDSNELRDEIPCSIVSGEKAISIAFSPKFLERVIKNYSGEISMYFSDSSKPAIIIAETEKNGTVYNKSRLLAPVKK